MYHKIKPKHRKRCIAGRRNDGNQKYHIKRSKKWNHPMHGGRLRSHFELWVDHRPLYQNWATIDKNVLHTIPTNGASIRNSAPTTPREPARTVDIVPGQQHNSLLCINKFAEYNYVKVFTPDEEAVFHGQKASISSIQQPINQGWRDQTAGLWRITIEPEQNKTPKYSSTPQEHKKLSNQHMM